MKYLKNLIIALTVLASFTVVSCRETSEEETHPPMQEEVHDEMHDEMHNEMQENMHQEESPMGDV